MILVCLCRGARKQIKKKAVVRSTPHKRGERKRREGRPAISGERWRVIWGMPARHIHVGDIVTFKVEAGKRLVYQSEEL